MERIISQPEWLNFRRCIWMNLCNKCKKFIVENEVIEDHINIFLCSKCKYVMIKYGSKYKSVMGNSKVKCPKCRKYFVPGHYMGEKYCKVCK